MICVISDSKPRNSLVVDDTARSRRPPRWHSGVSPGGVPDLNVQVSPDCVPDRGNSARLAFPLEELALARRGEDEGEGLGGRKVRIPPYDSQERVPAAVSRRNRRFGFLLPLLYPTKVPLTS